MKFKVTKIAAAVATSLGVSAVGMNVARADAILFPYLAVSDTVTSIVTVINLARRDAAAPSQSRQQLHYHLFHKPGDAALGAECTKVDVRRVTSPNDIVTFDMSGRYGADTLGVIAEPPSQQINANYQGANQSFALARGLGTLRGFLIVDNYDTPNVRAEGSLAGEIMVIDFAEGAVWGYQAYNAAFEAGNSYSFQDAAETAGEVLAGDKIVQVRVVNQPGTVIRYAIGGTVGFGKARSPRVPTGILPIASPATSGDVFTRFFVTPIAHSVQTVNKVINAQGELVNPGGAGAPRSVVATSGNLGNLRPDLSARVRLSVAGWFNATVTDDVVFDRDENPISGQVPRTVTCVGSVPVEDLMTAGALREIGDFGGWAGVQIDSPGPLVQFGDFNPATGVHPITARSTNNQEAIVIKLEYNPSGDFLGEQFNSAFNNATWLRYGHRESLRGSEVGGLVQTRFDVRSAFDFEGNPVDVSDDFMGDFVPVLSAQQ